MKKKWEILEPDLKTVAAVKKIIKCTDTIAAILVNRGISSAESAHAFINPSLKSLCSPTLLKDAEKAADRIRDAIVEGEKILIFGDYDADGVTATTLMFDFLSYAGGDVTYYIPHRTGEGYGLQKDHIKGIALGSATDLIITVDCGSSSINAIKAANLEDIDVIVTDHHETGSTLPDAYAIVNPKRKDCTANLQNLAGVGVAFYLAICVRSSLRKIGFWKILPEPNMKSYCDLVALGTIADIVPLTPENRILVKTGLEIMSGNCRPGIKALQKICKVDGSPATSDDIGFRIAPRLNAAGRLEHAHLSVELLTETKYEDALRKAKNLNFLNTKRQKIEGDITDEIMALIENNPEIHKRHSIVLASDKWHLGVLGIAASRITYKYNKPTLLISISGDTGKGSGRSIDQFDLYQGLADCGNLLERFGGHKMAAGLTISVKNIEQFSCTFDKIVKLSMADKDPVKSILIDCRIVFDDITNLLADELEMLQPFGCKNREPVFMGEDVHVISSSIIGGKHRKMVLKQAFSKTGKQIEALDFNVDTSIPLADHFHRVAFKIQWNRWRGQKKLQLIIDEI